MASPVWGLSHGRGPTWRCVVLCVREREREGGREGGRERLYINKESSQQADKVKIHIQDVYIHGARNPSVF